MTEYATLQERIDAERIVKAQANPRSFKQIGRNPQSLNFTLVIQRNLRWTNKQKCELIESALLGYPIPAVYAVKSNDNITWVLDGKQRIDGAIIPFMRNELKLEGLAPIFGVDVNGMFFKDLPEEFQEVLEEERINIYQFERLSPQQRDEFFRRLNSGTPLTKIELIRSILGEEILEWIGSIINKPLFDIVTENGKYKFLDVEMVMQMLSILLENYGKMSGNDLIELALSFRINGLSEELKIKLNNIIDYLGEAFNTYDEKDKKKILKKNDIVALVGAAHEAIVNEVDPNSFAWNTALLISKTSGEYKNTKIGSTNKAEKVKKRVDLLVKSIESEFKKKEDNNQDSEDQDENEIATDLNLSEEDTENYTQETLTFH